MYATTNKQSAYRRYHTPSAPLVTATAAAAAEHTGYS